MRTKYHGDTVRFKTLLFDPLSAEMEGVDGGVDQFVTNNNHVVTVSYKLGEKSAEGMSLGDTPTYRVGFEYYDAVSDSIKPCKTPDGGEVFWCPTEADVDKALTIIQELPDAPAIPYDVLISGRLRTRKQRILALHVIRPDPRLVVLGRKKPLP